MPVGFHVFWRLKRREESRNIGECRMEQYSVLMSVYYKENPEYFREALDSIWSQTVPTNDFVLVCDGPLNDQLDSVINEMTREHSELNVVRLEENVGLGNALNAGIRYCKNNLIARMDSDDISRSNRCERQVSAFIEDPELEIISGTVEEFSKSINHITGKRELPCSNEDIKQFSRKRNPFNHPAVMFRKDAVTAVGGYSEKFHLFEDYYLWVRMLMNNAKAANLMKPILYMRTPTDLYMRRGGTKYAKDMLAFHKWMRKEKWTNETDYLMSAVPHALVCVLPNCIRGFIYRVLHK